LSDLLTVYDDMGNVRLKQIAAIVAFCSEQF